MALKEELEHNSPLKKQMLETQQLSKFARIEDDNVSQSSEEERMQHDMIDEIKSIAVQHNEFSLTLDIHQDANVQVNENLEVIEISDEESESSEGEGEDEKK
jgi:hypothetical protein